MFRDHIKSLQKKASPLEPSETERRELTEKVVRHGEDFLEELPELPAYNVEGDGHPLSEDDLTQPEESIDRVLNTYREHVNGPGLNPASGGHLGYIPGGGIFHSALGDFLAAVTNRYAGVYFASPGAVRMENKLLQWMADIVGYPSTSLGNITSGGSIANLIAVVTARQAHGLKGKDLERTVIYSTTHVHHCMDKAFRIAGVGECIRRHIPMDERFRMDPEALEGTIRDDRANGLYPWFLVGSAGTTDTGAIDPLRELAGVAEKEGLWYHVDGAYGAFFQLTESIGDRLKGMEASDSLVMDPHKGLFLPYGSGVVLIREGEKLRKAHHFQADYMQDAAEMNDVASPAELSPELTRHFRGLRLWLPLKLLGVEPFRAGLEEKLALAQYLAKELRNKEHFQLFDDPQLSVVTFRYLPESGDPDLANKDLNDAIRKDGRVFLSSTRIHGHYALRAAILAFRTHLHTIDTLLTVLDEKVAEIAPKESGVKE